MKKILYLFLIIFVILVNTSCEEGNDLVLLDTGFGKETKAIYITDDAMTKLIEEYKKNKFADLVFETTLDDTFKITEDGAKFRINSLSSNFSHLVHPLNDPETTMSRGYSPKGHRGNDYPKPKGTPIYAMDDGEVVVADDSVKTQVSSDPSNNSGSYGTYVKIKHEGYVTVYAHMSKMFAKKGELVKKGTKIGEVGTTGNSTGNHLHFEVNIDGKPVSPDPYLARTKKVESLN